jgi:hypothetical protein
MRSAIIFAALFAATTTAFPALLARTPADETVNPAAVTNTTCTDPSVYDSSYPFHLLC